MGIRDELLSAQPEIVDVTVKGKAYRLKKPTVGERSRVFELAGLDSADPKTIKLNIGRLQSAALIASLVDENGAKVFTDVDFDSLLACPVGSPSDELGARAAALMNEVDAGKS